jgi:hypothetical protein
MVATSSAKSLKSHGSLSGLLALAGLLALVSEESRLANDALFSDGCRMAGADMIRD